MMIFDKIKQKAGHLDWRNLFVSIVYQAINTVLGLILPYLFITNFGSETNGLLSSVGQFFVYLDFLEAGVGGASQQAMYAPLMRQDRAGINGILSATNRYYKKTSIYYTASVLLLSVLYPLFVETSLSFVSVTEIILLHGAASICSYLFSAKYCLLLKADGKAYVLNWIMLASSIIRNFGKVVAISLGFDVVGVQLLNLIAVICQSCFIILYIRRKYGWLNLKVKPDFQAIEQKNSVLLQQLVWVVFNHTDVLVLTVVLQDLKLVSVYSLYTLVFTAVQNMLESISKGVLYKLGQKAQETREALIKYFRRYEVLYIGFSFLLNTTVYLLIRSFLGIYVGNVEDADYLMKFLPELFFAVRLLYSVRDVKYQLVTATGNFKGSSYIAVTEMIINVASSIILVFFYGIYGVLIGTIAALIYSCIAYHLYTNKKILRVKPYYGVAVLLAFLLTAFLIGFFGLGFIPEITNYKNLILVAIPVGISVLVIYLLLAAGCIWKQKSVKIELEQ